jgi:hypothetical protein
MDLLWGWIMGSQQYGKNDYWKPGTWNAACSMCGRKRKADEMVRNWQGLYRCPEHNEPRQPQDFARGIPDNMGVPWAQEEDVEFVYTCSMNGSSGIAGYANAGCMVPSNTFILPTYAPGS